MFDINCVIQVSDATLVLEVLAEEARRLAATHRAHIRQVLQVSEGVQLRLIHMQLTHSRHSGGDQAAGGHAPGAHLAGAAGERGMQL